MTPALPIAGPLFDAFAFAIRLRAAVGRVGGVRRAEALAGVSAPTISRACNGWPQLSHEAYLRLEGWMGRLDEEIAA